MKAKFLTKSTITNTRLINFLSPFSFHKSTFKFNTLLNSSMFQSKLKIEDKSTHLMNPKFQNFCSKNSINLSKTTYDGVLFKQHSPHLTEIRLNQPTKFNSLDLKMIKSLLRKIRLWIPFNIDGFSSEGEINQSEKQVPKILLFTGEGRAFCSGGDIVSLYNAKMNNSNQKLLKDFFRYEYLLDYSITKLLPLQIVLWQGAIMGGGVGISINSPFRVCTDSAIFAMPEAGIGLFTDVGASFFLPRLINSDVELGLFMGLTGERLSGKELAITGVATHYVAEDKFPILREKLSKIGEGFCNKDSIIKLLSEECDYVFSKDKFEFKNCKRIKYVFKLDSLKKIYERLENIVGCSESNKELDKELWNEDGIQWAKRIKKILDAHSPLSLSVIFELLKRGVEMNSIDEAYDLEAQVVAGFMEDSDFFEGVRALLVDKDKKPKWKHSSINEVNYEEVIKKYFDRKEEIEVDPNNVN